MSAAVEPFKFNFSPGGGNTKDASELQYGIPRSENTDTTVKLEATNEELTISDYCKDIESMDFDEVPLDDDLSLLKGNVSSATAAALLNINEVLESDLVPGKYEGGFKLWEGAVDLCNYLCKTFGLTKDTLLTSEDDPETIFKGKRVLELGCGHGLPGIIALLAGAEVHFQDYNKDVLTKLTIPNVIANQSRLPEGRSKGTVRFFSGDWKSFGEMLANRGLGGHYDYIFTAETIYSLDSQGKLLECMKQVIQPPQGHIFVAAKSYYFGVGGGVKGFTKLVHNDGVLESQSVWRMEDANTTTREIIRLKFPDSIYPYFL